MHLEHEPRQGHPAPHQGVAEPLGCRFGADQDSHDRPFATIVIVIVSAAVWCR